MSLKRLPFLANSDFHKPKHIYSWKTLLHCEKDSEAIKECIRLNEHLSITLYRDAQPGATFMDTPVTQFKKRNSAHPVLEILDSLPSVSNPGRHLNLDSLKVARE